MCLREHTEERAVPIRAEETAEIEITADTGKALGADHLTATIMLLEVAITPSASMRKLSVADHESAWCALAEVANIATSLAPMRSIISTSERAGTRSIHTVGD